MFSGCKISEKDGDTRQKSFLEIIENAGCEQITIYKMDGNGSYEISLSNGGKVTQLSKIQEIQEKEDIEMILDMFSSWNQEEAKVPELEILDLLCDVYIVFNDQMVVTYAIDGSTQNYYGTINETAYYLPEAFGIYIDNLF